MFRHGTVRDMTCILASVIQDLYLSSGHSSPCEMGIVVKLPDPNAEDADAGLLPWGLQGNMEVSQVDPNTDYIQVVLSTSPSMLAPPLSEICRVLGVASAATGLAVSGEFESHDGQTHALVARNPVSGLLEVHLTTHVTVR